MLRGWSVFPFGRILVIGPATGAGGNMRSLLRTLVLGSALVVLAPTGRLLAQATIDPMVGVWKLDVAKSTYSPDQVPQSLTVTIVGVGAGLNLSATGLDSKGNPMNWEFTANLDGKAVPATGAPDYNSVELRRVNGSTEITRKRNGKQVQTVWSILSDDGKQFTATTTGKNRDGKKVRNVAVFDRQ
jgi:hypothetical protein